MILHGKVPIGTRAIPWVAFSKMLSDGAGRLGLNFVVNAFSSGRCWTHHWRQSELQARRPISITSAAVPVQASSGAPGVTEPVNPGKFAVAAYRYEPARETKSARTCFA